jgi:hypothetical protein
VGFEIGNAQLIARTGVPNNEAEFKTLDPVLDFGRTPELENLAQTFQIDHRSFATRSDWVSPIR